MGFKKLKDRLKQGKKEKKDLSGKKKPNQSPNGTTSVDVILEMCFAGRINNPLVNLEVSKKLENQEFRKRIQDLNSRFYNYMDKLRKSGQRTDFDEEQLLQGFIRSNYFNLLGVETKGIEIKDLGLEYKLKGEQDEQFICFETTNVKPKNHNIMPENDLKEMYDSFVNDIEKKVRKEVVKVEKRAAKQKALYEINIQKVSETIKECDAVSKPESFKDYLNRALGKDSDNPEKSKTKPFGKKPGLIDSLTNTIKGALRGRDEVSEGVFACDYQKPHPESEDERLKDLPKYYKDEKPYGTNSEEDEITPYDDPNRIDPLLK